MLNNSVKEADVLSDTNQKIKVIFVYTNFGIGGIAKSLINLFRVLDYSKYDVTLYIRRDDVVDLINDVPIQVKVITIKNEVKLKIFEKNIVGKTAEFIYKVLYRKHKYYAKKFLNFYKLPIQRKKEKKKLEQNHLCWDVAISYSTDNDDPIFVNRCIKANKKYVFIHQSTKIDNKNVHEIKKFDAIVSVNSLLIPWIKNMVKNTTDIISIENYVAFDEVRVMANQKVFHHDHPLILATCGRICLTKGFDYVVQVSDILQKKGVDFLWYWIGDGTEREQMEKMIKENDLGNRIIITGAKKNPYPYMNLCDIYVQPSRAEAYTLTILEALILYRPVISTNTKGAKKIFEKYNCGISVDSSSDNIAEAIIEIFSNKSKLEAETKKLKDIQWEREKEKYIAEWNQLLSGYVS